MALRCMLRSYPKSLLVCCVKTKSYNQLCYFGSAVGTFDSHKTVGSFAKSNSSQKTLLSCNHTTSSPSVACVKKFTASSVKNAEDKPKKGDHTKLWSAERILAAGMLGIIPTAIMFPSQPMDCLLALSFVMHSHWGIEAIVVDYVRPIIFGKTIPVIAHGLVYALSIATLTGVLFLIFNDCGLANAIRLVWKL